jgi:hypothetical protein
MLSSFLVSTWVAIGLLMTPGSPKCARRNRPSCRQRLPPDPPIKQSAPSVFCQRTFQVIIPSFIQAVLSGKEVALIFRPFGPVDA